MIWMPSDRATQPKHQAQHVLKQGGAYANAPAPSVAARAQDKYKYSYNPLSKMPSIGAARQALLLAQIMHTAAYSALNVARPLRPVQLPSLRPRQSQKLVLRAAADAAGDDAVDEPAPTGLRAKLKKAASFKKGDLAKYGVSAFFCLLYTSPSPRD